MLNFKRCIGGLMPNLIKKSWKVSTSKASWSKIPLLCPRTMYTRRLNLKFFAAQIQITLPNLGVGCKDLVFCRNNGWIMKNIEKELTVPKWMLIVRPKIPQMHQNLSAQISAQAQKFFFGDFNEKRLHWASVVRVLLCTLCLNTTQ